MESVEHAIKIIKDSNYFSPWNELLVGEYALKYWQKIFTQNVEEEDFDDIGIKLNEFNVPYVIVSEYIDEIFHHMKSLDTKYFNIKNKIAGAYLERKLQHDGEILEHEIKKKLSITLELKKDLINAHLKWMKQYIDAILHLDAFPELNPKKCTVGKWILEDADLLENHKIIEIHNSLHAMAQSAIRMYNKQDYAYFLLLYIDMLNSSYQIRDLIMNIYFTKRTVSIYKDYLSDYPNYFQLKIDIDEHYTDEILVTLNIKDFSNINLLYGHDAGDLLIKEVIEFLSNIDKIKRVYRIYADEFVVVLNADELEYASKKLKLVLESHEYHVNDMTILLSFYASFSKVSEHALEYCEYGLMESEYNLGAFIDVTNIDETVFDNYAAKMTLSQKIRIAFLDNRIIPYYQPIADKKSNKIVKYEVLMRMVDVDGTILEPKDFLRILEEMYLYPEVTKMMINQAFLFFKDKEYEFSLNLSFVDIISPDTEAFIVSLIKQYPEVAKRCTFELLENEAIKNVQEVSKFFILLQQYGVRIAIDDFGSGFSNYDTIFQFDVDFIKIDGTLTESLLTSHKSRILIDSIITVARKINAKIIVEYVSSQEIYDYICGLDIDYLQGYFIGLPAPTLVE